MQHRTFWPLVAIALAGLSAAPRASAQQPVAPRDARRSAADVTRRAQVVARVNAVSVTVGELEDLLNDAPGPIRQTYLDPARRREFLENLVTTFLLSDEARRRGLDREPQVAQTLRRILGQRTEQAAILDAITPEGITDAEVREFYNAHLADYQQPEFRRATVVIAASAEVAAQVIADIGRARGDMRRVRELVRQHSVDEASKSREGDLFYFQSDGTPSAVDGTRVDRPIAAAAFTLVREMDVSPRPVPVTGGRFAVVVLTGMRPALRRSLDDVGVVNSIRGFIVRERRIQRRTELLRELNTRLRPEVHEERLDSIRLPPVDLGSIPPLVTAPNAREAAPLPSSTRDAAAP